ncbi:GNAT family N-acetyltransferase [Clostridium sp. AL.422]|nr:MULTISPECIES: GNAT family N-acetyltransferase [unclassified Clostridium]MDV4150909.1 GNAT family N-acetyltransferase [Clostridium sp. AL.422]
MGIAVSSDFRRNGMGKMLLDKVEKWALKTWGLG